MAIRIAPLTGSPAIIAALGEILMETIAGGGSVGFMHPLSPNAAVDFWRTSLAAAGRGDRIVLGAFHGDHLVGTVTLLLNLPPNQPHRAEIVKMMTRTDHRRRGVATALLGASRSWRSRAGARSSCSTPPSTTAHPGFTSASDFRSPESFPTTP